MIKKDDLVDVVPDGKSSERYVERPVEEVGFYSITMRFLFPKAEFGDIFNSPRFWDNLEELRKKSYDFSVTSAGPMEDAGICDQSGHVVPKDQIYTIEQIPDEYTPGVGTTYCEACIDEGILYRESLD
jgi:hypothetical protein